MITSKIIKNFDAITIQNIINFVNDINVLNIFKNNPFRLSTNAYCLDTFFISNNDSQIAIFKDNSIKIEYYYRFKIDDLKCITTLEDLKKTFECHNISDIRLLEYLITKELEADFKLEELI
jgi:hypothetical protein